MKSIEQFRGEYFFLSNFYEAPVYYNGLLYYNNEAAFQAQKVLDREIQKQFTNYAPRVAKARGKKVQLRDDWEDVKYVTMYDICLQKFIQNPDIRQKLIDTGDALLVEGNMWNDTTWGVSLRTGNGKNWLGIILMDVRTIMRNLDDIITLKP